MQREQVNEYRLVETQLDREWDIFVAASENGTMFLYSDFLRSLRGNFKPYYIYHRAELRAALLCVTTPDGQEFCSHDYVIYTGILFGAPMHRQNHDQILSERFLIATYAADELMKRYNKIELSLHPTIIDVRPFLWVNFGTELPKFSVNVRYTSYVDIHDFAQAQKLEDISIYLKASKSRRQEIRYAIQKKVKTVEEFDAARFVDFYARTMNRQDIKVADDVLTEMKDLLVNTYAADLGKMFISYTQDGEPGSMAYFGIDPKRAYYIFGANDPALRDEHTGTAVLWDAFSVMSQQGIHEVDLEGVNSPQRGWFKLSFGGDLRPYFEIVKKMQLNQSIG
ncbi:MAG: GNAT family N-acetyltransferase [Candidatus Omnitrophica bacterium]|nr:GNAT family N-acetyltransferase [Candidatus Omnitrophota bacterium]